jgi:hypothetical protein
MGQGFGEQIPNGDRAHCLITLHESYESMKASFWIVGEMLPSPGA